MLSRTATAVVPLALAALAAAGLAPGTRPAASAPVVPAAAADVVPEADVLAVTGSDAALWTRRAGLTAYESLGGRLVGPPAVAVDASNGTPYYVGRGTGGRIYVRTDALAWRLLVPYGSCTEPDAVVTDRVLTAGCRGTNGRLYVARAALPTGGLPAAARWTDYGGALLGGPTLTAPGGGSVEYVVRGTDDVAWSRTDTAGFRRSPVRCYGTPEQARAGAVSVLACRAADGALAYRTEDPQGTTTRRVSGAVVGRPAIALRPSGGGALTVIGTNGRVYRSSFTSRGPGGFTAAGGSGSGVSADRSEGAPVLVAAGDIACDPADASFRGGRGTATACRQAATAARAAALGPSVVAPLGDLQYPSGTAEAFAASYAPSWGRMLSVTRPTPGNHEYRTPGASGYYGYFGARAGSPSRGYYSYELGGWHVVALNSNCTEVSCARGSAQERWLRADLAAHPARCTLAYWHSPRFSSGVEHGSDVAVAPLYQALHDAGAEVVLAGHEHGYERFARLGPDGSADARGIRSFVVGTGGKSLYRFRPVPEPGSVFRDDDHFGVLALALGPAGYSWRFVAEDGRTLDSGSDGCSG